MKEHDLNRLIKDSNYLDDTINRFEEDNIIRKQDIDIDEIKGHMIKSDHNLRFVYENIRLGFLDWAIVGCYYSSYHAALALILTKGLSSKNHLATLCILIKHFYQESLDLSDITFLSDLLDYQDIMFYVESKNRREEASYSSRTAYEKKDVESLRLKAALFTEKIKKVIKDIS